jgi:hypothetical protein
MCCFLGAYSAEKSNGERNEIRKRMHDWGRSEQFWKSMEYIWLKAVCVIYGPVCTHLIDYDIW